jgi:FADH2 O2-dependent halogenase
MELFSAMSAFYFVAAIWAEQGRRSDNWRPNHAFLGAHDPAWMQIVDVSYQELVDLLRNRPPEADARRTFVERVRQRIAPYNLAGLCDPTRSNLYPYPQPA